MLIEHQVAEVLACKGNLKMKDLAQNQLKSQKSAEESNKKLDIRTNIDLTKVANTLNYNKEKISYFEEKHKEQEEELYKLKKI